MRMRTAGFVCILVLNQFCFQGKAQTIDLVAGGGRSAPPCAAKELQLKEPFYSEFDPQGRLVIAEMAEGQRILRLNANGIVELIAGTGKKGKPSPGKQPALEASFDGVHNIAIHPMTGDIYLADTWNVVVRKYHAADKTVETIAGTGNKGFSGDGGAALKADLGGIYCVALSPDGQILYLADLHNYVIRKIELKSGMISRVAGNGKKGRPKEGGIAIEEPLVDPRAVAADKAGNLYVLERGGNALRVVTPDGKIKTVVNMAGTKGLKGGDGPAADCQMNGPKHIQIDRNENVLIADAENHQILKYNPKSATTQVITGTGKAGTAGLGGPARQAQVNRPHGIVEAANGDYIITDSYNNRVLRIKN